MMIAVVALLIALLNPSHGQQDGTVRLIRNGVYSSSYTSGIVQMYYNGSWEGVCNEGTFNQTAANVICHQLGYTEAESFSTAGNQQYGSINDMTFTDVSCSQDGYQVLGQCSLRRQIDACSSSVAATVTCSSTRITDDPYSGQIRFRGGDYTNEGLVEVYCSDSWGTICDDGFDRNDAETVCRQLGYNDVATYDTHILFFDNSSQPIWLTNVECPRSATCISTCRSCPLLQVLSCTHLEDVSVQCRYDFDLTDDGTTIGQCEGSNDSINIALVVGVIIAIIALCILAICVPLCICCCLGVGIGAAVRSSKA